MQLLTYAMTHFLQKLQQLGIQLGKKTFGHDCLNVVPNREP